MNTGVYCIRNTHTGSCYIGSAVDIKARCAVRVGAPPTGKKAPPKLLRAWAKYGADAFEFSVLLHCSRENTLLYEQICIDAYQPKYNTRQEARSNLGIKWSAETNRKKGRPEVTYTVREVTGSLAALCKHFGAVSPQGARARMERGEPVETAVTAPGMDRSSRGKRGAENRAPESFVGANLEFRGVRGSLRLLVDRFGVVGYYAARRRLQNGWPIERALLDQLVSTAERVARSTACRWGDGRKGATA